MPAAGHKKIDETAAFPYVPRMNIFDQVSALWAAHQAVRMQPFGRGKSWIISLHLVLRDLCGEGTGERPSEGDGRSFKHTSIVMVVLKQREAAESVAK